jgi:glutathione S-transferase
VPVLVIEGRVLTEVAGILYYLARRFLAASLWPNCDPEAAARVISWMSFIASTLHPARRLGLDHARTVYRLADERLGSRRWAVDSYSIADIHLFRLFWRFRGSLGPDATEFPNLSAHHDRMMERSAVRKTCEIEAALGYELPL